MSYGLVIVACSSLSYSGNGDRYGDSLIIIRVFLAQRGLNRRNMSGSIESHLFARKFLKHITASSTVNIYAFKNGLHASLEDFFHLRTLSRGYIIFNLPAFL